MQKITTKDNSSTFFNEKYQEHYHSTSGAEEEAVKKFAQPFQDYLKQRKIVKIMDFCYGLGYNTAAFMDVFGGKFEKIYFVGLENDSVILEKIAEIDSKLESYEIIKEFIKDFFEFEKTSKKSHFTKEFMFKGTIVSLTIILDDALQSIKGMQNFDAVLFDPFSPKKHPEMWSIETLRKVKDSMKSGAALTTYSCAKTFRDTLRELGFKIVNGPCVGRKAPSTIGVKK